MISHKKKFIFVHINKTGGTSMSKLLIEYADILPMPHQFLCNELILPCNGVARQIGASSQPVIRPALLDGCKYPPHDYFKFAFVRNPWDKILSNYLYRGTTTTAWDRDWPTTSFKEWVCGTKEYNYKCDLALFLQLDWISDGFNNVQADFIGRFENLEEDFTFVCDKIDIPRKKLPHYNKTVHRPYWEYYDDETKNFVATKFKKDIEYFGYEFGS